MQSLTHHTQAVSPEISSAPGIGLFHAIIGWMQGSRALMAVLASLLLTGVTVRAQTTIYSDDFNRAALGGAYTISQGGGGGMAFIVGSTTLWLTNGTPAGSVSVATNIPSGVDYNTTLDSCSGLVTWTFNMRFGRTGGTPSGFGSSIYGVGYVLAANGQDFSAANTKGYAILLGNSGSPDPFRLVAFTNGIKADYSAVGSAGGNTLIAGTGAFSVATQAAANDYYSFQVTYDPATKIWTFYGRDDGSSAFADPATGSFTTIGTFTETTAIFRATALGRTGPYWNHSTGANNPSQFDNFKLTITGAGPYLAIDNTGTPAAGTLITGNNDVPVFGFQLTPSSGSASFTGLKLTTVGTATSSDLTTFRVIYDADNNGSFNVGDSVVSTSAQSLANPINFAITGQTSFSDVRRYLVIANVVGGAGHTFTGSIASPSSVTNTATASGSAAGNLQTIAAAAYDLGMSAVASSESATISSLMNDATITTISQGVQAWQVTFNNPAGNATASTITAINFTQGANNGVVSWTNAVQAAELFNGSTALGAGTVSVTNIMFSGLSVGVADNTSKTLTLRLSLKSTAGALKDNTHFQFAVAPGDVSITGNGVIAAAINSDAALNQIDVLATKLVLTNVPVSVVTNANFSVAVQAQDANGNVDVDNATLVTLSLATGGGTLTGGSALNLLNGTNRWTGLFYDTLGTFSLKADDGILTPAISGLINAVLVPTLTDVVMPQYVQGIASGSSNSKRLPFACCVALSNLTANATYRYYNACVLGTDTATSTGAGNCIIASASGSFLRTSNPSLGSVGNYGEFTTDANGSYTGWFVTEPTGNARYGTPGNLLFMRLILNDGASGTTAKTFMTTTGSAAVLAFNIAGANTGTGIWGSSSATDKNFVVLYDNVAGTGQPLAATFVESDGVAENTTASFVKYYNDSVDGISGAWGTIVPNSNANGVQRIEQRRLAGGGLVAFSTDDDGVWPSGANTVNPAGGDAAALVITATDAPLATALLQISYLAIQSMSLSGTNLVISGTNAGAGTYYVLASTNLALPRLSWTAIATNTVSGSGAFTLTATNAIRASIPQNYYVLSTTNNH